MAAYSPPLQILGYATLIPVSSYLFLAVNIAGKKTSPRKLSYDQTFSLHIIQTQRVNKHYTGF